MSYHWCETTHKSHMNTYLCLWMYQDGYTPLIRAARNGRLPVVEYLVERGADMEAKDNVSDVISLMWNHPYITNEHMSVYGSAWIHSIGICCNGRSFASGWISGGERSWYGGKEWCKWRYIIDVKPLIRHTCIYNYECIRMDTLHWFMLHGMVIYEWLNIWWRKELIWRQRMM